METLTLTRKEAMMVIEFYGQQAAQGAPYYSYQGEPDWDKHAWMTRYQTSLAVERQITEHDWHVLLAQMISYQSFDRDPEGWLNERGESPVPMNVDFYRNLLEDHVSWVITNCYDNSGA